MHSIRIVNPVVRVYDALIPPADKTLFHTHRYSGVGIAMTSTRLAIEKVGSTLDYETTKAGDIFPVIATTPYVHRVAKIGDVAYRTVGVELIQPLGPSFTAPADPPAII